MKPYYEENGIAIYHGDCREVLPGLPFVDLVLTDPPYGIGGDKAIHCTKPSRPSTYYTEKKYPDADWNIKPTRDVFDLMRSMSKNQIIWGGNYFASMLPDSRGWLYWDKMFENTINFSHGELAWTSFDFGIKQHRQSSKDETKGGRLRQHPTQKPRALMKWCLALAIAAQSVCDPYLGSGTTLRAAKDLGLQAVGIEIEERYCEIAANRLRQDVFSFSV